MTASFGVACADARTVGAAEVIDAADGALYTVKKKGGNAVELFGAPVPEPLAVSSGASG